MLCGALLTSKIALRSPRGDSATGPGRQPCSPWQSFRRHNGMTPLWSIVLAAGRGRRLARVTGGVPKQFWSPSGSASLLEATLTRIAPLTTGEQTLVVVDRAHRPYVERLRKPPPLESVVYQPSDRGTANGLLLPLSLVAAQHPEAIVFVTAADHGISQAEEYRSGIRRATDYICANPADVVLIAVTPSSASRDYGWIVRAPGESRGTSLVVSFVEEPETAAAERLLACGAVWNAMAMIGRVEAILAVYRRCAPDLIAAFESFRIMDPATRDGRIARLYDDLPNGDL